MKPIYKKAKLVREIDDVKTGQAFALYRGKHGLSQMAVAQAMDVYPSFLCGLEMGNRPWSEDWATKYSKAVEILTK